MTLTNQIKMSFISLGENVSIARITAASFAAQLDLPLSEIEEIKVAISEAVSNAIIHGYAEKSGIVELLMNLYSDKLEFVISDHGCGIADIEEARQPAFSSHPERMGLGFSFMESFMDELSIQSTVGEGTVVRLVKNIAPCSH